MHSDGLLESRHPHILRFLVQGVCSVHIRESGGVQAEHGASFQASHSRVRCVSFRQVLLHQECGPDAWNALSKCVLEPRQHSGLLHRKKHHQQGWREGESGVQTGPVSGGNAEWHVGGD